MKIKKMRMTIDFYKYLFFLNYGQGIKLIINVAIFAISFISFLYNNLFSVVRDGSGSWLFIILMIYSIFNISWSLYEKYEEISDFKGKNKDIIMKSKSILVKDDKAVQLNDIHAESRGNIQFENLKLNGPRDEQQEPVIYSEDINHYIWDNDFTIERDLIKERKIKKFIKKNREIITPFFQYKYYDSKKNNQLFFNESKLSMSSEINPKNKHVLFNKSNYYHSYLTNEISTSTLQRVEDATIIYDASNFYPCEHKKLDKENDITYLQPMDKCEMSNHIGISTLAVTKDNYLVIRKQGINTQQNINKYVPTGSGSADWSDIQNYSLHDTLKFAMDRELWEENGGKCLKIPMNKFGDTKVLGYFRWLRRGGKPEFVGITKLHVSLSQLTPDNSEFINTTNKADRDTFYLDGIDDVPKVIQEIQKKDNLSIPLQMCLIFLLDYYEERREDLEGMLGL
ncbi:hypothetical protein [Oceanobacillus jeddahense]|uniref:hypothetical protein n=1 Tax=Oceanobacillus jeddahense TaxID=1462527 RepID=UPI000595C106|nr:hypothetical protein [Oceanobacillus jeddahense]